MRSPTFIGAKAFITNAPNVSITTDIKASNVVLDHMGNAKLVDFGFAKMLGGETPTEARDAASSAAGDNGVDGENKNAWARTKSFCGTPHAMAPEMIGRQGDLRWHGSVLLECEHSYMIIV